MKKKNKKNIFWNVFKNIFLGLFGIAIIAMSLTIVSHFDKELKGDKFLNAYVSITWIFYILCKIYSEYYNSEGED